MSPGALWFGLGRSPAGVALLESLERTRHRDVSWSDRPIPPRSQAVSAAVDAVAAMSFGELVRHLVSAAERIAGPWRSDPSSVVIAAFESAPMRAEIAEAVVSQFGAELDAGVALDDQQWWG